MVAVSRWKGAHDKFPAHVEEARNSDGNVHRGYHWLEFRIAAELLRIGPFHSAEDYWAPVDWQLLLVVSEYMSALVEFLDWFWPDLGWDHHKQAIVLSKRLLQPRSPATYPDLRIDPQLRAAWQSFTYCFWHGTRHLPAAPPPGDVPAAYTAARDWLTKLVGERGFEPEGHIVSSLQAWLQAMQPRLCEAFSSVDWSVWPDVQWPDSECTCRTVEKRGAIKRQQEEDFAVRWPLRVTQGRPKFNHLKVEARDGFNVGIPSIKNPPALGFLAVSDVMCAFKQATQHWPSAQPSSHSYVNQQDVVQSFVQNVLRETRGPLAPGIVHEPYKYLGYVACCVLGWQSALQHLFSLVAASTAWGPQILVFPHSWAAAVGAQTLNPMGPAGPMGHSATMGPPLLGMQDPFSLVPQQQQNHEGMGGLTSAGMGLGLGVGMGGGPLAPASRQALQQHLQQQLQQQQQLQHLQQHLAQKQQQQQQELQHIIGQQQQHSQVGVGVGAASLSPVMQQPSAGDFSAFSMAMSGQSATRTRPSPFGALGGNGSFPGPAGPSCRIPERHASLGCPATSLLSTQDQHQQLQQQQQMQQQHQMQQQQQLQQQLDVGMFGQGTSQQLGVDGGGGGGGRGGGGGGGFRGYSMYGTTQDLAGCSKQQALPYMLGLQGQQPQQQPLGLMELQPGEGFQSVTPSAQQNFFNQQFNMFQQQQKEQQQQQQEHQQQPLQPLQLHLTLQHFRGPSYEITIQPHPQPQTQLPSPQQQPQQHPPPQPQQEQQTFPKSDPLRMLQLDTPAGMSLGGLSSMQDLIDGLPSHTDPLWSTLFLDVGANGGEPNGGGGGAGGPGTGPGPPGVGGLPVLPLMTAGGGGQLQEPVVGALPGGAAESISQGQEMAMEEDSGVKQQQQLLTRRPPAHQQQQQQQQQQQEQIPESQLSGWSVGQTQQTHLQALRGQQHEPTQQIQRQQQTQQRLSQIQRSGSQQQQQQQQTEQPLLSQPQQTTPQTPLQQQEQQQQQHQPLQGQQSAATSGGHVPFVAFPASYNTLSYPSAAAAMLPAQPWLNLLTSSQQHPQPHPDVAVSGPGSQSPSGNGHLFADAHQGDALKPALAVRPDSTGTGRVGGPAGLRTRAGEPCRVPRDSSTEIYDSSGVRRASGGGGSNNADGTSRTDSDAAAAAAIGGTSVRRTLERTSLSAPSSAADCGPLNEPMGQVRSCRRSRRDVAAAAADAAADAGIAPAPGSLVERCAKRPNAQALNEDSELAAAQPLSCIVLESPFVIVQPQLQPPKLSEPPTVGLRTVSVPPSCLPSRQTSLADDKVAVAASRTDPWDARSAQLGYGSVVHAVHTVTEVEVTDLDFCSARALRVSLGRQLLQVLRTWAAATQPDSKTECAAAASSSPAASDVMMRVEQLLASGAPADVVEDVDDTAAASVANGGGGAAIGRRSALYYACLAGDSALVALLLRHGADPDQVSRSCIAHSEFTGRLMAAAAVVQGAEREPDGRPMGHMFCWRNLVLGSDEETAAVAGCSGGCGGGINGEADEMAIEEGVTAASSAVSTCSQGMSYYRRQFSRLLVLLGFSGEQLLQLSDGFAGAERIPNGCLAGRSAAQRPTDPLTAAAAAPAVHHCAPPPLVVHMRPAGRFNAEQLRDMVLERYSAPGMATVLAAARTTGGAAQGDTVAGWVLGPHYTPQQMALRHLAAPVVARAWRQCAPGARPVFLDAYRVYILETDGGLRFFPPTNGEKVAAEGCAAWAGDGKTGGGGGGGGGGGLGVSQQPPCNLTPTSSVHHQQQQQHQQQHQEQHQQHQQRSTHQRQDSVHRNLASAATAIVAGAPMLEPNITDVAAGMVANAADTSGTASETPTAAKATTAGAGKADTAAVVGAAAAGGNAEEQLRLELCELLRQADGIAGHLARTDPRGTPGLVLSLLQDTAYLYALAAQGAAER